MMKNSLLVLIYLVSVSLTYGQSLTRISEVQGDGDFSPLVDKMVTVEGVVTGLRRGGFYIQTPDDQIDNNSKTSEGIYVYTSETPDAKVTVGSFVEVKGKVAEFKPQRDTYALFLTEIIEPNVKIISKENPLPAPIVLMYKDLKPNGQLDQLERFEGMRIKIDSLNVVAPTGGYFDNKSSQIRSDGVFFGVLPDTPRPFREPGLDALMVLIDKLPKILPVFDMNPESIRVDSGGLNGSTPIDVTSGATITSILGIIDYSFRAYTLLVDPSAPPGVANNREFLSASASGDNEITVASANLENFFDDEENSDLGDQKETKITSEHFEKRLKKASLAIRNVAGMPDVLGVIEVENLLVLKKLAERINGDAEAAGQANPKYEAVLEEGNDLRGIDVGFLYKAEKVNLISSKQLGKDLMHDHSDADPKEALFSRPPLLAEFEVGETATHGKLKLTVIVNHFKSFNDVETKRVQNKKRAQAEFLAEFVHKREKFNPEEKIVLIGDFNAFQFPDGYNDVIGTLKGTPDRNVLTPAENVYETTLVDLVDYVSKENRYSYVFRGSAQTLDHILINKPTRKYAAKFGYARLNADFPKIYENDENRPERVSDHDIPILYLKLDANPIARRSAPPKPSDPKPNTPKALLFYSFDKKETADDDPSESDDDWLNSKLITVVEGNISGNLFAHKGGGPNGAEWNPAGDLYLIAEAADPEVSPKVSFNGKPNPNIEFQKKQIGDRNFFWAKLPAEIWNANLREIIEADLENLFSQSTLAKVKQNEPGPAAPMETGRVIEIEIMLGSITIKNYFHAAFGE